MHIDLSAPLQTIQGILNGLLAHLPQIVLGAILFVVIFFVSKLVRRGVRRVFENSERENVGIVLGRFAQLVMVSIGLFVAVTIVVPSVHASSLFELLGVSSIGIGFAFKDILQNFLAGILILLNQPFKLRDQIIVGEFEGTVEDIQTRATFIRTYDGRRVVIPNSVIFTEPVIVNTAFEARRNEIVVGIGYGDDIENAKRLMLAAIAAVPGVSTAHPPDAVASGLGESSVEIRARWWCEPHKAPYLVVQDQVIAAMKKALSEAGVDLPFPTMQVLFHDQTEDTDGDRSHQREGWPAGKGQVPKPARGEPRAARGDDAAR